MNVKISTLFLIVSVTVSGLAFADADDIKWIAQCMMDSKDEGKSTQVVQKYCECMNEKMDDNEMRSVTQWEKSHRKEEEECSAIAGWK
jgi:hypothetical protein